MIIHEEMTGELIHNWKRIYDYLEDQESRDTYMARINFLISGDFSFYGQIIHKYMRDISPVNGKTFVEMLPPPPTSGRKIVLYGTGEVGRLLFHSIYKNDKRFIGFCSQNKDKQDYGFCGYPVFSPDELLKRHDLDVVISANDYREKRNQTEIKELLIKGGYPKDQVFEYGREGTERYDLGQYFAPEFITYYDEEILIDAGCYDLSSALEMRRRCKNLKKVYAFEPDPISYKRCLEEKEKTKFKEAKIIPAGTWDCKTQLSFEIGSNGSSNLSKNGEIIVPVVAIDETIDPGDTVTYIKLDVEGAELESLKGAKNTIMKYKPKLAVCLYHKPEDMFVLPHYIKQLVPEYKLYVRHHSNVPQETVLYAIIQ